MYSYAEHSQADTILHDKLQHATKSYDRSSWLFLYFVWRARQEHAHTCETLCVSDEQISFITDDLLICLISQNNSWHDLWAIQGVHKRVSVTAEDNNRLDNALYKSVLVFYCMRDLDA